MNLVILVGRLTEDPTLRTSENGRKRTTFSIATNDRRGNQGTVEYHDCVVWERLAEIVAEYAKKGKLVEVIGRQSTRKYTNRDGIEVRKTEVVADRVNFIDSGARSSSGGDDRGGSRRQGSSRGETNYPPQQEFDPELGW